MEDQRISQCFRIAKKYLQDYEDEYFVNKNKFKYICHCIHESWLRGEINYDESKYLKKIISIRLMGYVSVSDWLKYQKGIVLEGQVLVNHRHAWIDSLIEEFSEE